MLRFLLILILICLTSDGENNNVSLLGMPKENDWILHSLFSDIVKGF